MVRFLLFVMTCLNVVVCIEQKRSTSKGETRIRLVNGTNHLEGRVELFYNGEWGTICDNGWDFFDAVVACRQLGNYAVKSTYCCGAYGSGAGIIHLDNLRCTGDESRMEECVHSGWGTHNCRHSEDSGVACTDIRINGGSTSGWEGVVESLHDGKWGNICLEDFDQNVAKVFCYQLHMSEPATFYGVPQDSKVQMKGLRCSGNESTLASCTVSERGSFICGSGKIAAVICKESGNIRLIDGVNLGEGRLEVFYGGTWGTVCDDNFGMEEAIVACRQLGYRWANRDNPVRKFGAGTGPIHLNNVICTGAESRIDECRHPSLGDHNCGHSEDVGVSCDTSRPTDDSVDFFIPTPSSVSAHCREPLGMENGNIGGVRITASGFSESSEHNFAPPNARLNLNTGGIEGDAWKPVLSNAIQWIQVDLRVPHLVTGVQTQGRNRSNEYVTQYVVKYSQDSYSWTDSWKSRQSGIQNFIGNTDDNSVVTNYFDERITARFIRIVPVDWNRAIALRFELLGCGECHEMRDGSDYRGSVNTTITGKTCQRWTSQVPHEHSRTPLTYPDKGLGEHNFCRNPDMEPGAWCYTMDRDSRFEMCDIGDPGEFCGNEKLLVRLQDGRNALEGRVELFHGGAWGTVCDDSFGVNDAKVICRMLGFQGADPDHCCKSFGPGTGNIILDDLACFGSEDSLELCRHNGWGKHNCNHHEDVGVICKRAIRLVGGETELSGRVEVFHGNEWGTICNEGFDERDGHVVCSMMGGYRLKRIASANEFPPKSNGPIVVTNMHCQGTEGTLDECKHQPWGEINMCSHDDDVAIECEQAKNSRNKKPNTKVHIDTYQGIQNSKDSATIVGLTILIIILVVFIVIFVAILIIRKKNERNRISRAFFKKDHNVNVNISDKSEKEKEDTPFCT